MPSTPGGRAQKHIDTMLAEAGWVVQDAAAFDFSAGPGVALRQYDVHTLLRLPTGIFYAQGVKANMLFFERNPLTLSNLEDFIACYNPDARHNPEESECFRSFAYDELAGREKNKSRHLLAERRQPRRHRKPPGPRCAGLYHRREPGGCTGAVQRNPGGVGGGRLSAPLHWERGRFQRCTMSEMDMTSHGVRRT